MFYKNGTGSLPGLIERRVSDLVPPPPPARSSSDLSALRGPPFSHPSEQIRTVGHFSLIDVLACYPLSDGLPLPLENSVGHRRFFVTLPPLRGS